MSKTPLNLARFLPYQLSVLQALVSHRIGAYYRQHWALTRNGWRLIAALANQGEMTATAVGQYVQLEKMQVSRAVKELLARGFISQSANRADRRQMLLALTEEGLRCYQDVAPQLISAENELMAVLTAEEQAALRQITQKLLNHLK